MSVNEANKGKLPFILKLDHQSVLVTGDVKHHSPITHHISPIKELDDFIRVGETGFVDGVIPELQGCSGIGVFFPKCSQRTLRENAHG